MTEDGLKQQLSKLENTPDSHRERRYDQLSEEINRLYVAVTRTKKYLARPMNVSPSPLVAPTT